MADDRGRGFREEATQHLQLHYHVEVLDCVEPAGRLLRRSRLRGAETRVGQPRTAIGEQHAHSVRVLGLPAQAHSRPRLAEALQDARPVAPCVVCAAALGSEQCESRLGADVVVVREGHPAGRCARRARTLRERLQMLKLREATPLVLDVLQR